MGQYVGVGCIEEDWSVIDEAVEEVEWQERGELHDHLTSNNCLEFGGANPTIQVQGAKVYKASVLKEIMLDKDDGLSNDRLRRVRGLTRSTQAPAISEDDKDSFIMTGEPVIVNLTDQHSHNPDEDVCICIIKQIRDGKATTEALHLDNFYRPGVTLNVQRPELLSPDEEDDRLFWSSKFIGQEVVDINSKDVIVIRPSVSTKSPPGMTQIYFSKSDLKELGVTLAPARLSRESRKCKLCTKFVKVHDMRRHVGKHILYKATSNTCGFCGGSGCVSKLNKTSHGRKKDFYNDIVSDCAYYFNYGKLCKVPTLKNPCTNRLLKCPNCDRCVWFYGMAAHFTENHEGKACPFVVSDKEKRCMSKSKV